MTAVHLDSTHDDARRRSDLYAGDVYVYGARPSTLALCDHARTMIEEAFDGIDPRDAQHHMSVERYVEICAPLKPRFIHDPTTQRLVRGVLEDLGCDLDQTYQDVPRLRMVTSDGYLTSGVGFAHHPHRDTWYSAPMCQLNWWLPIYEVDTESVMAFHPPHWTDPVRNGSSRFDYYEWNRVGRAEAAKHVTSDTREQPRPESPVQMEPQVRFVPPVGGIVLFSAAQLHSTVPNTTGRARYSIDFRTVDVRDVADGRGAPNIDSDPTGTSLRDFVRAVDRSPMPEELAAALDGDRTPSGALVYRPG